MFSEDELKLLQRGLESLEAQIKTVMSLSSQSQAMMEVSGQATDTMRSQHERAQQKTEAQLERITLLKARLITHRYAADAEASCVSVEDFLREN